MLSSWASQSTLIGEELSLRKELRSSSWHSASCPTLMKRLTSCMRRSDALKRQGCKVVVRIVPRQQSIDSKERTRSALSPVSKCGDY